MKRALLLSTLLVAATTLAAQQPGLTVQQILRPSPSSWPTYNGDYTGRRYSALTKITDRTVKHLSLAWLYDLPTGGGGTVKGTPLSSKVV